MVHVHVYSGVQGGDDVISFSLLHRCVDQQTGHNAIHVANILRTTQETIQSNKYTQVPRPWNGLGGPDLGWH